MEPCHLCGNDAELQESHLIPNWALRDEIRAHGGAMVDLAEWTNRGRPPVMRLLGSCCEQLFSKWENPAKLFGRDSEPNGVYGPWLFRFATSISWRVLKSYVLTKPDELSEQNRTILAQPYVAEALDCWRDILLHDKFTEASKRHRQYIFPVAREYTFRQAACMLIGNDGANVFVWTRFSYYGILGLLHSKNVNALRAGAIQVNGGQMPGFVKMPGQLLDYLQLIELHGASGAVLFNAGEPKPSA